MMVVRIGTRLLGALVIVAAGCARTEPGGESANLPANVPANAAEQTASPPEPGTPGGLPDDRTPLSEPNGPIDPRSAEAAGQVVQSFGALIEQGRSAEAEKLWGDPAQAAAFTKSLRPNSHLQVGKPGEVEGAAGSSYVTVPVVIYGDGFSRRAEITLRRVNDVDGSTEAQRRWHIERIADVAS